MILIMIIDIKLIINTWLCHILLLLIIAIHLSFVK